jgi:hypothetical protein
MPKEGCAFASAFQKTLLPSRQLRATLSISTLLELYPMSEWNCDGEKSIS